MWTKRFLEERSHQQVKLGDTKSRTVMCRAGVPQGSVISSTLFNVHINDLEDSIPGHLNVSSCKYADDCTQYDIIQEDDNSKIQEALDAVDNWAIVNKIQLNPKLKICGYASEMLSNHLHHSFLVTVLLKGLSPSNC